MAESKKCETIYCRNDAAPGRTKCYKCISREYKKNHPFRYHYNALRNNAKRRGKAFNLSFKHFKRIWNESGRWPEKVEEGQCKWQVDRIEVTKGYVDGNIQIITKRQNILKYVKHGRFRMEVYWAEENGQQRLGLEEKTPF